MKILVYYIVLIISTSLFLFVDKSAQNIFSVIAPLFVLISIFFIFYDILKEENKKNNGDSSSLKENGDG
ncbi:MAG: hypothetical protein ACQESP_07815 [Candidatus Muiribacteriota bacterium]